MQDTTTTTTPRHISHYFRHADGSDGIICECGRTFATMQGFRSHRTRARNARELAAEAEQIALRAAAGYHTLTVFNAVDVPYRLQHAVLELLKAYSPDIYERPCDADGRAL